LDQIEIILPFSGQYDDEKLQILIELINDIYLQSERIIWPTDGSYFRIRLSQLKELIELGHIRLAILNDEIIGVIKIMAKEKGIATFGLLAVNPKYRKHKVGSALIENAENWAKNNSLAYMELELLKPIDQIIQDKVFLENWYGRIGYKKLKTYQFEELYPSHAHLIQLPCLFEIFRKKLI
jgi:GNAT superfamily N-acetyltransferase